MEAVAASVSGKPLSRHQKAVLAGKAWRPQIISAPDPYAAFKLIARPDLVVNEHRNDIMSRLSDGLTVFDVISYLVSIYEIVATERQIKAIQAEMCGVTPIGKHTRNKINIEARAALKNGLFDYIAPKSIDEVDGKVIANYRQSSGLPVAVEQRQPAKETVIPESVPAAEAEEPVIDASGDETVKTGGESQGTTSVEGTGKPAKRPPIIKDPGRVVPEGYVDGFIESGLEIFKGLNFPIADFNHTARPREISNATGVLETDLEWRQGMEAFIVSRIEAKEDQIERDRIESMPRGVERVNAKTKLNEKIKGRAAR